MNKRKATSVAAVSSPLLLPALIISAAKGRLPSHPRLRRMHTYLRHHGVEDIPKLERADKDQSGRDALWVRSLLGQHAKVEHHPANETGAQLAKKLNVKVADARVELVTDEKVVCGVA